MKWRQPLSQTLGSMLYISLLLVCSRGLIQCSLKVGEQKNKIAFGQWLVTGLFVTIVLSVPMCIALLLTEHVLLAFHLDPVLCKMSAEFMHPLTTSVPFLLVFLAFTKYLQCQHILSPSVWIGVFANIVNLILGLTIIYALDGGFMGASIATAISRAIQLVIMLIYLMWSKKKHIETWPTFRSLEPLRFSKLKRFFGIGIYGGIMVALEAWCFEVMTFLAGSFGAVAVDTHTTMLSVVAFMWMAVPFPLATATSIRVGNLLGAGNYAQCRTTAVVGVSSVAICSLVASGMVFACRKFVGQLFSSEEEVLTAVSSLMFIGNLFGVFDGTQAAVSGLFRGMGRQRLVAGLNLVGFWVIGVPASCILAFKYDLEVAGLWWGLLIGLVATSSIGCVLISRVDWKKEATNAQARIKLETEASGENDKQKANQESGHVQGEDHDGNADVDGNDDGDVDSAQGIQIQEIELPNVKLIGPEV
eukprot:c11641_g1_i1.p1 GENE.c11641_g1_i1~~c11641_g1_i1.p1  ORF type:complete len:474 (+),score=96.60 c11641_g1_i1:346-1767(+)